MLNLSKFSKRQILTLVVFAVADFCNAICVSLQAPFFPYEAELKGATASEYGLVFGIFELVVFLISPLYGQHLNLLGPERMFHGGILVTGSCSILFGFLDRIEGHLAFITAAFIVRIIEAMGNAAFLTASFAIIANEFPDNVATTFASLETFFGLGLIVGPTLGGVLYSVGGYTMPFAVLGSWLFITAIITGFLLPTRNTSRAANKSNTGRLLEVLSIKGMPICAATIISTSMSISFLTATLEPHLRTLFNLSAVVMGLVFVVTGATYAVSATGWGWLCDKYVHPKCVALIGCVLLICGFSLVGPAPFLPLYPSLKIIILGLMLHGLGIGARLVSSFTDALQAAVASGLSNNLETYGLVSGLWTSLFALGAFIGPTISGILYDTYGFSNACLFIILLMAFLGIFEYMAYANVKYPVHKGYGNLDNAYVEKYDNVFCSSQSFADSNGTLYNQKSTISYCNTVTYSHVANNKLSDIAYHSNLLPNVEKIPLLIETSAC